MLPPELCSRQGCWVCRPGGRYLGAGGGGGHRKPWRQSSWTSEDNSLGTVAARGGWGPTSPSVLCSPFLRETAKGRGAVVSQDATVLRHAPRDASQHSIHHQSSAAPGTGMPSTQTRRPVCTPSTPPWLHWECARKALHVVVAKQTFHVV